MANKKRPGGASKSNAQRRSARPRSRSDQQRRQAAYRKKQREKWVIRIITIVVAIALIVTFILSVGSCNRNKKEPAGSGNTQTQQSTENESESTEPAVVNKSVKLTAVGDIIAHDTILELAKNGDSYNFDSLFAPLKADISKEDLAICNVETPLGGGPYTGYPSFNTPDEMGDAVINAGFDVALQASNHSMDSGTGGIRHAIEYWKGHDDDILMVGLHDSANDEKSIPIIEKNGIRFAVLNYTYGLNGYEIPEDESYLITVMDDAHREFISNQIKEAKENADFVIVCPHWGEENQVGEPLESQKDWAKLFTEAGADLILGTHPHVIENIEWVTSDNGNRALCYYSLGNFVSNQQYTDLVLGAMASVEIEMKDGKASIVEGSAKAVPVVTHNDKSGDVAVIQTYYLADYTPELAAVHDTKLSFDDAFSLDLLKEKAAGVLGDWMIERLP